MDNNISREDWIKRRSVELLAEAKPSNAAQERRQDLLWIAFVCAMLLLPLLAAWKLIEQTGLRSGFSAIACMLLLVVSAAYWKARGSAGPFWAVVGGVTIGLAIGNFGLL